MGILFYVVNPVKVKTLLIEEIESMIAEADITIKSSDKRPKYPLIRLRVDAEMRYPTIHVRKNRDGRLSRDHVGIPVPSRKSP